MAKPENFTKSNSPAKIWKNWIGKYFHLVFKGLKESVLDCPLV
jgi:hypothetical protein